MSIGELLSSILRSPQRCPGATALEIGFAVKKLSPAFSHYSEYSLLLGKLSRVAKGWCRRGEEATASSQPAVREKKIAQFLHANPHGWPFNPMAKARCAPVPWMRALVLPHHVHQAASSHNVAPFWPASTGQKNNKSGFVTAVVGTEISKKVSGQLKECKQTWLNALSPV